MKTIKTKKKQLFKILIGAAWIDGEVQEKELLFLEKLAVMYLEKYGIKENVLDDPEIIALIAGTPVPPSDCHRWLQEYLDEYSEPEDYHQLIESISSLFHADRVINDEEAELINELKQLDPFRETNNTFADRFLKILNKFTHRVT